MKINIRYQPTAQELAKASSLYIEKKPFMYYAILVINGFAYLILLIMILKAVLISALMPNEWLAGVSACLWIFGRKPFNEWLLFQRMKRSQLLDTTLSIDISLNGIAWTGPRVVPGSLKWNEIRYILEAKNGFVLPIGGSQFLWLPFRGFSESAEIEALKQALTEHHIKLRLYPNWEC